MSARTPTQAVHTFVARLQQAVGCITQSVISISGRGYASAGQPHTAALNRGHPVPLDRQPTVWLSVMLRYRILESRDGLWTVETVEYIYSFRDQDDGELLGYHWHPVGLSRVTWPHLHVGGFSSGLVLGRTHLPTGYVALQDIIRLAIEEFAVSPRRPDWARVLEQTRQ